MNKKLMLWIVFVACFSTSCATKFEQGLSYYNKGQYDKSIAAYQEAIRKNPNDYESYTNLGIVYNEIKQYNKAIESYLMAIKIEPRASLPYYNLGITYHDTKQYPQAIRAYEKTLSLDRNHLGASYNLGLVYSIMSRYIDAINILNTYLNLARNIPEQRELVQNAVYLLSTLEAEMQRQFAAEQQRQREAELQRQREAELQRQREAELQRQREAELPIPLPPPDKLPRAESGLTQADRQAIQEFVVQFPLAYLACRGKPNVKSCIALRVGVGMRGNIIPLVCAHPDYVGNFLSQERVVSLLNFLGCP